MQLKTVLCVVGLSVLVGVAQAEKTYHHHVAPTVSGVLQSPSTVEYTEAMTRMHNEMNIVYTHDADVDFVRGMIPHHQAAVDMAKTQLKYGKDPVLRQLSQEIIQAQEREIELLQRWLKTHEANQHQH